MLIVIYAFPSVVVVFGTMEVIDVILVIIGRHYFLSFETCNIIVQFIIAVYHLTHSFNELFVFRSWMELSKVIFIFILL